jgi:hypothetical protein
MDNAPTLFGGRLPNGSAATEFLMPLGRWNYNFAKFYDDRLELPAGDYRLYILPDGGRATVTLRFRGLSRSIALGISHESDYTLEFPDTRLLGASEQGNVYWGGASNALRERGLIFNALWLRANPYVGGQFQFCHYGIEPAEPTAYGPGCPAGTDGFGQMGVANDRTLSSSRTTKLFLEGFPGLRPSDNGQGVWYATESLVEEASYLALWLEY